MNPSDMSPWHIVAALATGGIFALVFFGLGMWWQHRKAERDRKRDE